MPSYYGQHREYDLDERLGKGGEGAVHRIRGDETLVAKIYHESNANATLKRKIAFMITIRSSIDNHVLPFLAWPIDTLCDRGGKFCGFVMPKVAGSPINKCYDEGDFSLSYRQRVRIARNLCAVVDTVHSIGQTIGDFNPNNIIVNRSSGNVALVDTDSFHLTNRQGVSFPCNVGLGLYLAPELQGVDLRDGRAQTYNAETDRFALAVHIFCLLMNGVHPFATRLARMNTALGQRSVALPSPESLIKTGESPHFTRNRSKTLPPKFCPPLKMLPSSIIDMFARAFDAGHSNHSLRPSAKEWYGALRQLEQNISDCQIDGKHSFPGVATSCPWCEIYKRNPGISRSSMSNPGSKVGAVPDVSSYRLKGMLAYLTLALLYVSFGAPAIEPIVSSSMSLRVTVWAGTIVGAIITWMMQTSFIEKWPAKGKRSWEVALSVISGLAACALTPVAVVVVFGVLVVGGLLYLMFFALTN